MVGLGHLGMLVFSKAEYYAKKKGKLKRAG
jgi:hypothetical protein